MWKNALLKIRDAIAKKDKKNYTAAVIELLDSGLMYTDCDGRYVIKQNDGAIRLSRNKLDIDFDSEVIRVYEIHRSGILDGDCVIAVVTPVFEKEVSVYKDGEWSCNMDADRILKIVQRTLDDAIRCLSTFD